MKYIRAMSLCAAVAVTCGGLFLAAAPAFGAPILVTAPPEELVVRHVSYADLNLAAAAGQTMLNRRVRAAVTDLCIDASGGDDRSMTFQVALTRCSGDAWNQARPQIANAVQRAQELASTGQTTIAAAALVISVGR
jgi:UrcA family protein